MGFVKTVDEIAESMPETPEFYGAEMLAVFWETRPEIVERLLPPPLKPAKTPLALAFAANYPETNFGVRYLEAALFLRAEFDGEEGNYCLAMPVTNDMALALGREVFGYPKKIGAVGLERKDDRIIGWAERHEVRYLQIKADMTGVFNSEDAQAALMDVFGAEEGNPVVVAFNYKHFPAPEVTGFDYPPRLIREEVEFRPEVMEFGQAEITLDSSPQDPWAEVEVVKVLGAVYIKGNNTMRPGAAVAEVEAEAFFPYAFLKWDF